MTLHIMGAKAYGGGRMPTPVDAPASGSMYANEPAGMTLVAEMKCDTLPTLASSKPTGWTNSWGTTSQTNLAIVTDATAEIGGPSVLRIRYPNGFAAGSAPCNFWTIWSSGSDPADIGECSELFIAYAFKVVGDGTDFQNHVAGTKLGFFSGPNTTTGQNDFFFLMKGGGGEVTTMTFGLNQQGAIVRVINGSGSPVIVGQWHTMEMHAVTSDPSVANGTLDIWFDGVSIVSLTDVTWRTTAYPRKFCDFKMNPTFGGSSAQPAKAQDDDIYFSNIYISGKL